MISGMWLVSSMIGACVIGVLCDWYPLWLVPIVIGVLCDWCPLWLVLNVIGALWLVPTVIDALCVVWDAKLVVSWCEMGDKAHS